MYIKEYRIPMPLSVEEYRIAQLYMVAKFSRERTTKGEGVEILANEPFENENGKGQYTHKMIHLGSHLPAWVKPLIPTSVSCVEEKAWNAYPYVKNVYSVAFFGERFSIVSETRYFDDDGTQENVHGLDAAQLKQREVEYINIATDPVDPRYYKEEEDPKLFTSKKTGRGPLTDKDWMKEHKPRMCIYKIAYVEFKVWGFQTTAESWIQKSMMKDVLTLGHKQAFCWMDEWVDLTMEDIRKFEEETKELLNKILHTGQTPIVSKKQELYQTPVEVRKMKEKEESTQKKDDDN
eukprot:TRINITY_DN289_c0_g1_i1.p1 TRINITY_DN289_c0_g1~~TRINITY_DN289_c0_g1_i1.p1  ORF type:complete len:292 (-),score=74.15 TRINITY_DN289_c0_g1_i1:39-914(-)